MAAGDKILDKMRARAAAKKAGPAGKKKKGTGKTAPPIPVKIVHDDSEAREPSRYQLERDKEKKEHGGFEKYEVEEACRAIEKAAEVMKDKKLMAAVEAYHSNKHAKIMSLSASMKGKLKDE